MAKNGKDCFVIMPISDPEGYEKGHFQKVYDFIIREAVDKTKFNALRADEVKETNLIQLDILNRLIEAPIAICDLSSRNPNVLFELGIRQAFDKPTVLIQEEGTPKIFDISSLRIYNYKPSLEYKDVLETQIELKERIEATVEADGSLRNINSIVKLMAIDTPAKVPQLNNENKEILALDVLQSEMQEIKKMLELSNRESVNSRHHYDNDGIPDSIEDRFEDLLKDIKKNQGDYHLDLVLKLVNTAFHRRLGNDMDNIEGHPNQSQIKRYQDLIEKIKKIRNANNLKES